MTTTEAQPHVERLLTNAKASLEKADANPGNLAVMEYSHAVSWAQKAVDLARNLDLQRIHSPRNFIKDNPINPLKIGNRQQARRIAVEFMVRSVNEIQALGFSADF